MFKTKAKSSIFTTFSAVALIIFICLLVCVVAGIDLSIDNLGLLWAEHRNTFLNWFFKIYTFTGSVYFMIIVSVLTLVFMKNKKQALALALCLAVVGLLNLFVKLAVARPRPDYGLIEESGKSFPSGHAMISMCYYGFLIYLSQGMKRWAKLSASISLPIAIFTLGMSRVYLGVHYMSDVIAGWCLGFVVLVIFVLLYELIIKKLNKGC